MREMEGRIAAGDSLATSAVGKNLRWSDVIEAFYRRARDSFASQWTDAILAEPITTRIDDGGPPVFWKTIGDEVVFWKELCDDREIWLTLACWLHVISDLRVFFRQLDVPELDVKSTAWLAGFPIRNKAIPIAQSEGARTEEILDRYYAPEGRSEGAVDFIGPGIDVGFRLQNFSSAKKFVISLDCAYLLAKTRRLIDEFQTHYPPRDWNFFPDDTGNLGTPSKPINHFSQKLMVNFDGAEPLKGVLGGIPYPRFWINTVRKGSLDEARERFDGDRGKPVSWANLLTYCERFYDDRAQFIARPFINRESSCTFGNMTAGYQALYGQVFRT